MTALLQTQKQKKSSLSTSQKTFNRLRKKVDRLQSDLKMRQQLLDQSLQFYYEKIEPEKKLYRGALRDIIKLLYPFFKAKNKLSKKERKILKEFLLDKCSALCCPDVRDEEMESIFEDLAGISYDTVASEEFDQMKDELQSMLQEKGVDIDFSNIEMKDNDPELMKKIFESLQDTMEKKEAEKPKSKKQQQKELKAKELEEIQKNGLRSIYKELAKAFHPDLELCPQRKIEKAELMKKLTVAYENNDLHSLLSLQMECLDQSENNDEKVHTDDQMKIYNLIFKDQIQALEMNIEMLSCHPKYEPIENYLDDIIFGNPFALKLVQIRFISHLKDMHATIENLQAGKEEQVAREIIASY